MKAEANERDKNKIEPRRMNQQSLNEGDRRKTFVFPHTKSEGEIFKTCLRSGIEEVDEHAQIKLQKEINKKLP
ncbi:CLUMA_CG018687, isoform A [Clunio marinus]|uniref:CLUMA_CG018687, isoform A n=1 Tax=Clunio marinus TaxID=568069 RepID=A0A1J1IZF2_9DIPT|nr:CLUMA_CG018687, isoform A [Clunio marinus]